MTGLNTSIMSERPHTPYSYKGLVRFFLAAAALLLLFGLISPLIVSFSPALQLYGELQDFYEIHSGALYYTDLKTQHEIQSAVRSAMERNPK